MAVARVEPDDQRGVAQRQWGTPGGDDERLRAYGPPSDAQERRPALHHVLATCRNTGTAVVLVVERRGRHRAPKLDAPLAPDHHTLRCPVCPAHGGPHRNPLEGLWRVRKDALGAGRCVGDLQQLSWRTRQGLRAQQERPLAACHWWPIVPRTSRDLLTVALLAAPAGLIDIDQISAET